MAKIMLEAIKPMIDEFLNKAKAAIPGLVEAAITRLTALATGSVERVTALFRGAYASAIARLTAWLPSTIDKTTALAGGAYDSAVKKLAAWLPTTKPTLTEKLIKLVTLAGQKLKSF